MIEYTYTNDRDNTSRSFRITVFKMRIGDGIAVNEHRTKLADEYAGNDILLTTLYTYPLLRYSSRYEAGDTPETVTAIEFTQDEFMALPEELAQLWIAEVLTVNPQHGVTELEHLGKLLGGLLNKNDVTGHLQTAGTDNSAA